MKHTLLRILPLLALLLCAACSSDDADGGKGGQELTLDIPIDIYSANSHVSTRVDQGDPGNDVVFKAPLYLYVYAYISENDGNSYELLTQTFTFTEDEASSAWTKQNENTVNECWRKNVRVTFQLSTTFHNELGKSRVYAIASRTDLSGVLPDVTGTSSTYTTMAALEAMTANFSSFTSDQLKDIYSTPANDRSNPVTSSDNGIIMKTGDALTCSTVKLYHVAAKVDFTWEVPASLRNTVSIASIQCTDLPTTCKVFEPTSNPTGTATSTVLGATSDNPAFEVNEGNKWIGRAYAFMLQPPSPGTVHYTVTYGGSASRPATTSSITPATDAYSNVYTGWYRVIADVKE